MTFKQKNTNYQKMKTVLFLVVFFCFYQKSIAQEFEWAYTIPALTLDDNETNYSHIQNIITNSDNEIYMTGYFLSPHDFGNQSPPQLY